MTTQSPLLQQLIDALRCLPGVGPKSAGRMAFHLLQSRYREQGHYLCRILNQAIAEIRHCSRCRNYTEMELCYLCQSPRRQQTLLCIVETPADVLAIEQSSSFNGVYFVLMGHLSPLDNIGPDQLGLGLLLQRMQEAALQEIIIATNPTVEGEATAHYIAEMLRPFEKLKLSRIAHGVPIGGELEFIDSHTLARALAHREILVV